MDMSILMSSTGEFVEISAEDKECVQHLTRFVPSEYKKEVAQLLQFRNKLNSKPFFCERFYDGSNANAEVASTDMGIRNMKSGIVGQDPNVLSLCPFGRRLLVLSKQYYYPDTLVDSGHNTYERSKNVYSPLEVKHWSAYPIIFAPPELLKLALDAQKREEENISRNDENAAPSASNQINGCKSYRPSSGLHAWCPFPSANAHRFSSSAPDAGLALAAFGEVGPEASLLFDSDCYPTSSLARYVTAESINGVTYAFNGPHATKGVDLRKTMFEVDAYLHDKKTKQDASITLKGDYVTLHTIEKDMSLHQELHIALLNMNLADDADDDSAGEDSDNSRENAIYLMQKWKSHILRLLSLRDYLESNRRGITIPSDVSSSSSALEKGCMTVPGEDIRLTADGIAYTAITVVDMPYGLEEPGRDTLDPPRKPSKPVIVRLKGAFPDRTILDLDLRARPVLVHAVLPDGDTAVYDLEVCLRSISEKDNEYISSRDQSDKNCLLPSVRTSRHVRSLLAFRRWASVPAYERDHMIKRDKETAALAQASVLRSQRHLLLLRLRSGQMLHREAADDSMLLREYIGFKGRDVDMPEGLWTRMLKYREHQHDIRTGKEVEQTQVEQNSNVDDKNTLDIHHMAREALKQTEAFLKREVENPTVYIAMTS